MKCMQSGQTNFQYMFIQVNETGDWALCMHYTCYSTLSRKEELQHGHESRLTARHKHVILPMHGSKAVHSWAGHKA